MSLGRFIVIEGLEGAGKTTAITTVCDYLKKRSLKLLLTREPGGTSLGETVRSLIKDKDTREPIQDWSEILLIYASRVQLVETVIQPALKRGEWVLSDRFELSTFAYQGGGRGIDAKEISTLSNLCLRGFKPDLQLFLDISPEQGLERAQARGETDRIESESLAFFKRVYFAYREALPHFPHSVCIDASQPLNIVQEHIIAVLDQFFSALNRPLA